MGQIRENRRIESRDVEIKKVGRMRAEVIVVSSAECHAQRCNMGEHQGKEGLVCEVPVGYLGGDA